MNTITDDERVKVSAVLKKFCSAFEEEERNSKRGNLSTLCFDLVKASYNLALARIRAKDDCIVEETKFISCFKILQDAVRAQRVEQPIYFAKIDELLAEAFDFQQSNK
jgi:hypothetical protein